MRRCAPASVWASFPVDFCRDIGPGLIVIWPSPEHVQAQSGPPSSLRPDGCCELDRPPGRGFQMCHVTGCRRGRVETERSARCRPSRSPRDIGLDRTAIGFVHERRFRVRLRLNCRTIPGKAAFSLEEGDIEYLSTAFSDGPVAEESDDGVTARAFARRIRTSHVDALDVPRLQSFLPQEGRTMTASYPSSGTGRSTAHLRDGPCRPCPIGLR